MCPQAWSQRPLNLPRMLCSSTPLEKSSFSCCPSPSYNSSPDSPKPLLSAKRSLCPQSSSSHSPTKNSVPVAGSNSKNFPSEQIPNSFPPGHHSNSFPPGHHSNSPPRRKNSDVALLTNGCPQNDSLRRKKLLRSNSESVGKYEARVRGLSVLPTQYCASAEVAPSMAEKI